MRIRITPLVSSNASCKEKIVDSSVNVHFLDLLIICIVLMLELHRADGAIHALCPLPVRNL